MKLLHDAFDVVFHHLTLLLISRFSFEDYNGLRVDHLGPSVDDGVDQPRLHPISRIVVAESNAEASQNGRHLAKFHRLSAILQLNDW